MQNVVFLAGLNRDEKDYKKLAKSAPKDTKIFFVHHSNYFRNGEFHPEVGISDFLIKNDLTEIILAGHSLGGAVALAYAAKHPDKIEKLILVDSAGITSEDRILKVVSNFLLEHKFNLIFRNLRAFWMIGKNPKRQVFLARHGRGVDLQKEAESLKIPTLILWGEKDHIIPLWKGELLNKLIKKSRLHVLPNKDHDWILKNGELFWLNW